MRDYDNYDRQAVRDVFEQITEHTVHHGGGTFQHKTGSAVDLKAHHGHGYLVSVEEYGDTPLLPRTDLSERIAQLWPRHIGPHVQYVGTWVDGGRVYVDGSTVIPDLQIALSLARKHNQQAIYNLATGESEYIDNAPGGRVELPDVVEFGEPGPNVVYWSDDRPYCPHCATSLDAFGSVVYAEMYPNAWIKETSAGTAVVYYPYDYPPIVMCAACGEELEIDDVIAR